MPWIASASIPDGHPLLAHPIHLLGTLRASGDLDAGIALLEEAVEIRRRLLPSDHYWLGVSCVHLGVRYVQAGRLDDAEPVLLDGYDALRASAGEAHRMTRWASSTLRELYESLGDSAKGAWFRDEAGG